MAVREPGPPADTIAERQLEVGERVFRPGGRPDPAQVATFAETHRHTFGVAPLLAAIGEPVSTFYDRSRPQPSAGAVADAAVAERIEAIWERSRRSYGAPRIHTMLAREGILVGRKRVARLMRQLALPALTCTNTGKPPGKTGAPRGSRSGRAEFHRRCAEHAVGRRPDLYQNAARNPLPGGGAGCVLPQRWWVGRWPTP